MAVVTEQELNNFSQLLSDTSPKGDEIINNNITESDLLAFEAMLPPVPSEDSTEVNTIPFQLVENLTKKRVIDWTKERIDKEKETLDKIVNPFGLRGVLQPTARRTPEQDLALDSWWRDQGQFVPRSVLTEMGVQGGNAVPTTQQLQRLESVQRVEDLRAALNLTPTITEDPIKESFMAKAARGAGAAPQTATMAATPQIEPIAQQLIKNASLEDAERVLQIMGTSPLDFPPELIEFTEQEIEVKKIMPDVIKTIGEQPLTILLGTDFFNKLAFGLPGFLSEKGLSPVENLLGLQKGSEATFQTAVARVREQIAAEDPRITTQLALGAGGVAADLIKFALLPDPSKLKVFAKLSPAVKAAIGVGSRAGLVALLEAPEEGETIEERTKEVAIATGVGALTGATLTKLLEGAKAIFTKIKDLPVARQADEILLNNPDIGLSKQETISLLKHLKSTNPEQFKIAISGGRPPARKVVSRIVPELPTGFRGGFAEIQKPGEFAKKAIEKAAPELKGPAAVAAAKALSAKAIPVKSIKPTKILTKAEVLSFQESNLVTGEDVNIRIVPDEKSRRLIQGSEKEIAKLKTQKAQLQADKKVALTKAKAVGITEKQAAVERIRAQKNEALSKVKAAEIAKKEGAIDKLRERLGVKLETTIEGAKAKIDKINQATEFKEGLRKDAISMLQAVPKDLRADFMARASKIGLQSQRPETALKALRKLTEQISIGVDRAEQRTVIGRIKTETDRIEEKYRRGVERLGKLPEPQRSQIMELIDSTDFKKLTDPKEADLVSLQTTVKRLSSQLAGNIEALDADVEDALKLPTNGRVQELLRLSQKKVADMDLDDLLFFEQSLTNLVHNASLKKSLLVKGGLKPIEGALKEISGEIKPTRRARKEAGKEVKQPERTGLQKVVDVTKKLTVLDDSHLDTLVELSTANQRDTSRQILDADLHEGQRTTAIVIWDSVQKSAEAFEKIGFTLLSQLEPKRVVTLAGQKIKIEEDFLVKLEMHMRSPDNLRAILKTKGWTIEGKDFDYPDDIDRMAELQAIRAQLPEMSKGIADWTKKLNVGTLRPVVNETALASQGHELARDDNYTSRPRSIPQRVEGGKDDISIPPEQRSRFLPRTGGTARLRLDRWSTDFLDMIESEAFFHGMSIPLRNARIILSSDSFQTDMRAAGRELELKNMITILRRTQGIQSSKSLIEVLGSKIMRGFTSAALGFRISTRGTQVMSFYAAQAETGIRPGATLKPQPKWVAERILEDSAVFALRERGQRIGAEIGANAALDAFDLLFFDKTPKLAQKGFRGITKGDSFARDNIYQELVVPEILQKARNGKNVNPFEWEGMEVADLPAMNDQDTKAFRYAAARRLEYVFRRTQPMFDMLDRSVTLGNPRVFQRSLFIFRTALEAQENIIQRSINAYAGSPKTVADKKALTSDLMSVAASATAVAIWKRAFKWAVATGATAALAAFGVFKFKDKKEKDEIASTLAKDTFKNIIRLNKMGKFIVDFSEQAANTWTGDGYNWNRETFELPIMDVLQSGGEAGVALTQSIVDVGKLDEFVEEVTTLDRDFNEQLADSIAKDMSNAIGSSFEFGARITGIPVLAPFQEFIKPFLQTTKIKLIREITFDDMENPNAYAQRIHDIFEERSELRKQSKTKRLTSAGDGLMKTLDVFASRANNAAEIIKQTADPAERKRFFATFERGMATIEQQIKDFKEE